MRLAAKPFQSPPDMLSWQYRSILEELGELQRHAADPTCPCTQADKGEYCLPKHALGLHVLAKETAAMDSHNRAWLTGLAEEALEQHHALRDRIVCGKQHRDERDTEEWARSWRKRVEPIYYACKVKLAQPAVLELAQSILAPSVAIRGTCSENKCSLKVKAATEVKREVGSIAALPAAVQQVQDALEAQKGPKASDKTFAIGPASLTRYQFRYRLVEAKDLLTSHNPDTFQIEPRYPQELQPRLRERAATQLQVTQMAANIDPDSLLTEFHSIDRGAPIVGSDNIVESGNGRVMALKRAVAQHPDSFKRYRQALHDKAPQYALSPETVDRMAAPVLVRERLTQVDRRTFALEANAATTIAPSAIETARTDAKLISLADLNSLTIGEGQGLGDALKHRDNLAFVRAFTGRLPQNEQARMVDAQGQLNQEGVRRMTLALFVATFPGDAGLRLAEKFFEATDNELRNVLNGITLALGPLTQAEALARDGKRDRQLAISEDLAKSVEVLAAIKSTPGMTVEKYLAQSQLFERQLSPFQERLMGELASRSRSGRAIGGLLRSYAQAVMDSPPPQQAGLLDMPRLSKDEMLATATARQSDILRMGQELLELFQVETLEKHVNVCNLSIDERRAIWSNKALRDFVLRAAAVGDVEVCQAGFIPGSYQVTIKQPSLWIEAEGKWPKPWMAANIELWAKKVPNMRRIHTPYAEYIYTVVLPTEHLSADELLGGKQYVPAQGLSGEKGEQAKMFASMAQPTVCQSLANVAADEGKAGDAYRGIAFAARNEGMGDVARRLLGIARMEDRHLETIRGLIDRNCQGAEKGVYMAQDRISFTQKEAQALLLAVDAYIDERLDSGRTIDLDLFQGLLDRLSQYVKAEMRDPILATIAAQICSTGACFANGPKLSCRGKS